MDDKTALIDDLTDGGVWSRWLNELLAWANDYLASVDTLIELACIAAAAGIAWPASIYLRRKIIALSEKHVRYALLRRLWNTLSQIAFPIAWLVIQWFVVLALAQLEFRHSVLVLTSSLLTAWIVINVATVFVANPLWSQTIAVSAWIVAALNILGLLDSTISLLDGAAFSFGQVSISALTVIQGAMAFGILLWVTALAGQLIEGRIKASPHLTPSIQVLSTKLLRVGLATIAFIFALKIVGLDLTAFAVFGGAIAVGLGFGLQKIFANLVSGFILLLDKSIKPGDVIAVTDYYGRVDSLGARYVSVWTRDGIEHLIPNEELITNRVENWSHSQNLLRLKKTIGVHYKADVHKAIELCREAARETPRVLEHPNAVCLARDFGDSSVDLEIRFWIDDPMNGRANVISEILLRVWDKFHEHDIEIPYPQRDIHVRSSVLESSPRTAGEQARLGDGAERE